MKNKNIALHGSYYGDNFGDTLFVTHFLNWINEDRLIDNNNILLPFACQRVRNVSDVSTIRGLKALFLSNGVVFIGGGYLGERPNNKTVWSYRLIIRHLSIALFSYFTKKPYIFIGVGAGPLSNILARKLSVFLCNRSNKVIVRDEESKQFLVDYGVKEKNILVTADSILTLSDDDIDKVYLEKVKQELNKQEKDTFIGIHLPITENISNIEQIDIAIKDLKKYCERLHNYKLVVLNDFYKENYNYIAYKKIQENFSEDKIIFKKYENPQQLIALIHELDILLTTKLHCGIVANCFGKYTISISTHDKTIRLYKQLKLEQRCIPLKDLRDAELLNVLLKYDAKNQAHTNIPEDVRKLAYRNKEELIKFIKGV